MKAETIRKGITMVPGTISRNLLFLPMVSSVYILEDGGDIIIFDPSCGKKIGRAVESYIKKRKDEGVKWENALIFAGHSHIDHANNFYLKDVIDAPHSRTLVHEKGFVDGQVLNDPFRMIAHMVKQAKGHYNIFRGFPFPYSLLLSPFVALDAVFPNMACSAFAAVGSLPWSKPRNGTAKPEALLETDLENIDINGIAVKGWKFSKFILLPTPGHSPCSVSLLWLDKKAIFTSDVDWPGNPVFINASIKDCIASLSFLKALAEADAIQLYLPSHETSIKGKNRVILHLDGRIGRLERMKDQVLSLSKEMGEKNVLKLTKKLIRISADFQMARLSHYPRFVSFTQAFVAVTLLEYSEA